MLKVRRGPALHELDTEQFSGRVDQREICPTPILNLQIFSIVVEVNSADALAA